MTLSEAPAPNCDPTAEPAAAPKLTVTSEPAAATVQSIPRGESSGSIVSNERDRDETNPVKPGESGESLRNLAVPFIAGAGLLVVLMICVQVYRTGALHPRAGDLAAYTEKTRLVLQNHHREIPDLARINLSGEDLSRTDFFAVNLRGANLERANLEGAVLYGCDLTGADLVGADLKGAMLDGANLTAANLQGADVRFAKFDPSTKWPSDFPLASNRSGMQPEPFPSWQTQ